MAEGMMNNPNAPMGGQPPMGEPPMGAGAPMGGREDAILDMHLTPDVKQALQSKGIDIGPVADRGPTEPVVVIPVSIVMARYPGSNPEESMQQFVQDMTANAQPPATEQPVSAPMGNPMGAEAPPPSPEGLGAPTPMDRPPMTA
tara:strand:- start:45 stop:476 length:432 start_codon:yes stop_codon:yes gene_type:complete